ncbi:MAG: hypothetical protein LBC83_04935, partial [Oscillospiraceae bacterium]|nr:hypothetical protein [Oscillospiraceae bacterium]
MKNRNRILSVLITGVMLLTIVPGQFGSAAIDGVAQAFAGLFGVLDAQALESQALEYPAANVAVVRRPVPEVQLRTPNVIRVTSSAASPYSIASASTGGVIVKATPSGVPETPGGLAGTAYAGESLVTPTINLQINKRAEDAQFSTAITSIAAAPVGNVTGGQTVTLTQTSMNTASGSASWTVGGSGVKAGSALQFKFTVKYKWLNPWVHIWVEDTYEFYGYSYVENVIYPAGVWLWAATENNKHTSGSTADVEISDIRAIIRLLGANTYGSPLNHTGQSDNSHGYINFALGGVNNNSDSFATRGGGAVQVNGTNYTNPTSTMFMWDPSRVYWYGKRGDNSNRGPIFAGATATDGNRPKAVVYMDPSAENLSLLGLRMSIYNNAYGRGAAVHGGKTVYYRTTYVVNGAVNWNNGVTTDTAAAAKLGIPTTHATESARDRVGPDGETSSHNGFPSWDSGGSTDPNETNITAATPHKNYKDKSFHVFNDFAFGSNGKVQKSLMAAQTLRGEYHYLINGATKESASYTLIPYLSSYNSYYKDDFWNEDSTCQTQALVGITLEIKAVNKGALRSAIGAADLVDVPAATEAGGGWTTTYTYKNGTDPETYGMTGNTAKGVLPQSWYYTEGFAAYATAMKEAMTALRYVPTNDASVFGGIISNITGKTDSLKLAKAYKTGNYTATTGGIYSQTNGTSVALADDYSDYTTLKTLATLITNVNNGSYTLANYKGTVNLNILADWNAHSEYYTVLSANRLKQAFANAREVYDNGSETNVNILYQTTIDKAARDLQDAIEQLEYALLDLTVGNAEAAKIGGAGYTSQVGVYNPFSIPAEDRQEQAKEAFAAKKAQYNAGAVKGWQQVYVYTEESRSAMAAAAAAWNSFAAAAPDYRQLSTMNALYAAMINALAAATPGYLGGGNNAAWNSMVTLLYTDGAYSLATTAQKAAMDIWINEIKTIVQGSPSEGYTGNNSMGAGGVSQMRLNELIDLLFRYIYTTPADYQIVRDAYTAGETELARQAEALDPQGVGSAIYTPLYHQDTIDSFHAVGDPILQKAPNGAVFTYSLADLKAVSALPTAISDSYTKNPKFAGASLFYLRQILLLPTCPQEHYMTDPYNTYSTYLNNANAILTPSGATAATNWIADGSKTDSDADHQGKVNLAAENLYLKWIALDGGHNAQGGLNHTGHKTVVVTFRHNDGRPEPYLALTTDMTADTYPGHGDLGDDDFGLPITTAEVPAPTATGGKTFVGWYTSPTERTEQIQLPMKYPTTVKNYYAHWDDNALQMTFLPGASAPQGIAGAAYTRGVAVGENLTFQPAEFTHTDWIVDYWLGSDGTTRYDFNTEITPTESMTFTAHWVKKQVRIIYAQVNAGTVFTKWVDKGSPYAHLEGADLQTLLTQCAFNDAEYMFNEGYHVAPQSKWNNAPALGAAITGNITILVAYDPNPCAIKITLREEREDGNHAVIQTHEIDSYYDTRLAVHLEDILAFISDNTREGYTYVAKSYSQGGSLASASQMNPDRTLPEGEMQMLFTLRAKAVELQFFDSASAEQPGKQILGNFEFSTADYAASFAEYVNQAAALGKRWVSTTGLINTMPATFPANNLRYDLEDIPSGSVTFTLTFAAIPDDETYTGAMPTPIVQEIDTTYTLPALTQAGFTFKGWSTDYTEAHIVVGTYVFQQNRTLYAIWSEATPAADVRLVSSSGSVVVYDDDQGHHYVFGFSPNTSLVEMFGDY